MSCVLLVWLLHGCASELTYSGFLPWFCKSIMKYLKFKNFYLLSFFNWRIIALQGCVPAVQPCESAVYIHTHIYSLPLKPPSLPPPSPPSRSSQSTELCSSFLPPFISHMVLRTCQCHSQFMPLFFPCWIHKSVLNICVSIPTLQIGSSIPLF